jgi:hypothetical protein
MLLRRESGSVRMAMVVARGGAKKSTTPLCPRQACHPRWAAPAPRTVLRACCTVRGYRHLQLARNGGNGLRRRRLCWRPPAGTAAAAAAAATAALGSAFFAPSSALWLTGRALARCEEKKEDCGEGTRCASESAEKVEPPAPGSEDEARMVAEIPEAHLLEYIASVERPMLGEPRSSLMHMAETGRAVLAARLLSLGANPNLRDARGRSPLHVAAWKVRRRSMTHQPHVCVVSICVPHTARHRQPPRASTQWMMHYGHMHQLLEYTVLPCVWWPGARCSRGGAAARRCCRRRQRPQIRWNPFDAGSHAWSGRCCQVRMCWIPHSTGVCLPTQQGVTDCCWRREPTATRL